MAERIRIRARSIRRGDLIDSMDPTPEPTNGFPYRSLSAARPRTVLVTGGLGDLGQALARHLVSAHGVRHLVLTSRRGLETPGASELAASLEIQGAHTVDIAACDLAERQQVASVLASIPAERPLSAVFHLAGVVDDAVLTELSSERLSRVLRPKVDGAVHLHELTRGRDLSAFVMFSSASGVMDSVRSSTQALSPSATTSSRVRASLPV